MKYLPSNSRIEAPALVIDLSVVSLCAQRVQSLARLSGTRFVYSVKACPLVPVLKCLLETIDGFSTSSLYETRLVREIDSNSSFVVHTSPIIRDAEVEELGTLCNRIALNSLSQFQLFDKQLKGASKIGIRLNPRLSFIEDARYDPCRRNSKLGVPLEQFRSALRAEPKRFANLTGIHCHSNCDSDDSGQLLDTIGRIESVLGDDLRRFQWFNVGGGYEFADELKFDRVIAEFQRLSELYDLEMVIEPGASIVRSAGSIVSTVEDILEGDDYPIAVLDTTVNHWPEVFEYQFEPDVEGHVENGRFTYLLAGCSCLAGDLFGVYSFDEPLDIGSQVTFLNAGAYSIVKAHMFNGINLPNIYVRKESGELELIKRFTYEDYSSRCGVGTSAIIGT